MKQQPSPEKIDLFKNTFRASMPLTDDYVFHAVFGRDTEESRAALIENPKHYFRTQTRPDPRHRHQKSDRDSGSRSG